ncbi:hypothetical protein PG996_004737 [Apiospora saccharicola]|uniref:F-box domain-containing protein n=1 Tax=Apiospora saccharicola TaxID=335842 RepID=A0ABR1W558_9PEZI
MTSFFPFLRLPRELRNLIYVSLFKSLVFDRNNPETRSEEEKKQLDPRLALLHVCRQIHAEASPLVLRHVTICCMDASDMLRCLMSLNPEQIRQLKYLNVCYSILCFNLPDHVADEDQNAEWEAGSDFEPDLEREVRGYHVGALLGLFPGLQLDLLVLEDGMSSGMEAWEAAHGPDLVTSLLQADGFREVRVSIRGAAHAFTGCRRLDGDTSGSVKEWDAYGPGWEESIRTRFRDRPGWSVDLYVEEEYCPQDHWDRFREMGITVRDGVVSRMDAGWEESEDRCSVAENYWTFRACRGRGVLRRTPRQRRQSVEMHRLQFSRNGTTRRGSGKGGVGWAEGAVPGC